MILAALHAACAYLWIPFRNDPARFWLPCNAGCAKLKVIKRVNRKRGTLPWGRTRYT